MEDGYVSADRAARRLRVSRRAVRNMVREGKLEGRTQGDGAASRLEISAASVERLLASPGDEEATG